MSQEAVHQVIGRAVTDVEFRRQLFADPDAALSEYSLTPEERAMLEQLDQDEVAVFAGRLDERITKSKWTP